MIKRIIERYIHHQKDSGFNFDKNLTNAVILSLIYHKLKGLLRSIKFYHTSKRKFFLFLGKSVSLFNRSNIILGNNVNISDYVHLSALGKGRLKIGNNVSIGSHSQLVISTSFNNIGEYIIIGDNVGIGDFAYVGGGGGTEIGNDTIIGQYFSTHPENHVFSSTDTLIRHQGVSRKGIKIGANCWIGAKVTILDGVEIGNNCVLAAGSVVTKSFSDNSVIGGVPAKLIRMR